MNLLRKLSIVLIALASNVLLAQNPPPPPLLPPGGGSTPGPGLPIDTNILFLVIVAIIFGSISVVRKYRNNQL